ncbi:hypothetical protein [Eubacterium sp.]|uniref:hypothetical protein n=1 Tax=Eubacterium sp. TaxID=142586 RepID=UPI002FC7DEA8
MRKKIGTEGTGTGQISPMKLSEELKNINIELLEIESDGGVYLTFADTLEAQVDAVCVAHDPTPLPVPPTETQLLQLALAEAIEKQEADKLESQIAQAEAVEKQEADKLELQLALAEFIESQVTEGGV